MAKVPSMSFAEFEELRRMFNVEAGLHFDSSARAIFRRRLGPRLLARDLDSFTQYVQLLRFGPHARSERGIALDLVTTGETYFFRHQEQLDVLGYTIMPALSSDNWASRRLTIWSAGCATGEEVYTSAILALESGLFDGWTIRVIGTDISPERIEHARQACYFQGAFRSTPDHLRERYFESTGRFWQVRESVRRLCSFSILNLLRADESAILGRVDVILCRNVLLYLDDAARRRVIGNLYDRLVTGGYLLLGHSESLKFLDTPIELASVEGDLAYRRPELPSPRGTFR